MNTSLLFRSSAGALSAGGFLWVLKFVVIAATHGAESGWADTATAVLYLSAVGLMALGMAGLGTALVLARHRALAPVGAVGGLVAWWLAYLVLDGVSKAAVGDSGPPWMPDEAGIVVTGAVLMTVGLLLLRSRGHVHSEVAPAR